MEHLYLVGRFSGGILRLLAMAVVEEEILFSGEHHNMN